MTALYLLSQELRTAHKLPFSNIFNSNMADMSNKGSMAT